MVQIPEDFAPAIADFMTISIYSLFTKHIDILTIGHDDCLPFIISRSELYISKFEQTSVAAVCGTAGKRGRVVPLLYTYIMSLSLVAKVRKCVPDKRPFLLLCRSLNQGQ